MTSIAWVLLSVALIPALAYVALLVAFFVTGRIDSRATSSLPDAARARASGPLPAGPHLSSRRAGQCPRELGERKCSSLYSEME
jgi:hypothetical protein